MKMMNFQHTILLTNPIDWQDREENAHKNNKYKYNEKI